MHTLIKTESEIKKNTKGDRNKNEIMEAELEECRKRNYTQIKTENNAMRNFNENQVTGPQGMR